MNKIISIKKTSSIFLATLLILGTIATISPSFMVGTAQADSYLEMENNHDKSYGKDNYKSKDSSSVIVKKVDCNNINVNLNGLELNVLPPTLANVLAQNDEGEIGAGSYGSYGDGQSNYDKNRFKFVCINNNNNTVVGEEQPPTQPTPPIPPEPTTATLTVKKQVFGCDIFTIPNLMDCQELQNDSPAWLDCNTNPAISGTIFCQSLPESIFDIEVLDDQNSQIQEFVGSEQGTTIQNLEPGTYTVNEIKHLLGTNQLGESPFSEANCLTFAGFPDGGSVLNSTANIFYEICFEYEDEQGNDCSTITLAAGEERTCIVKNYIRFGFDNV